MVKRLLAPVLLALLVAGSLFFLRDVLRAQGPPPHAQVPPEKRLFDADGNKLFDNLEARIAPAGPWERFEVIVLFHEPLEELDFEGLHRRLGLFQVRHRYRSINGISTTLPKWRIEAAARLDVVRQVELNAIVLPHLDKATLWFGVQKARTDFGVDGNADGNLTYSAGDIVVAVLDTGVNASHVDLDGGKVIGWRDFINGEPDPYDEGDQCVYHGTHVSSIAAGEGDGNASYRGVAPGAALVVGKVLGIQTTTSPPRPETGCFGYTSQVNAGIEWVIENKDTFGIEVLNMSLGVPGCSDGTDSQSLLINAVADAGIVPAISAGNEGPGPCTVGSPGAAQEALTVGAMAGPEHGSGVSFTCGPAPAGGFYLVCFSSRGPTADGRVKPDVAGAGVLITAADGGTDSGYTDKSGTSMSSPFTAGVAALIQHARLVDGQPLLAPQEVKNVLMLTAHDWGPLDGSADSGPSSDIDWGAGRLDGYRAVKAARQGTGANIDLPQHQFISDSLTEPGGANEEDLHTINVADPSMAIAATLIMPTWSGGQPDFDLELKDNYGNIVSSGTARRQDTVGIGPPANNGPYTLRVFAYPGSEAGPYLLDISAGTAAVAMQLTTDGWTPFGNQGPGVTIDTTSAGTDDVQTVQVTTGPADLFIQTTLFTSGTSTWSLGTSAGSDQAVWQFSTNGNDWEFLTIENTLYSLASGVAESGTVDLYLRLTLPAAISAPENEYGATVTITAVPVPS